MKNIEDVKVTKGLSVQQESANFGYQDVQGIIESHKDKEEPSEKIPFKSKPVDKTSYKLGFIDGLSDSNVFTFSDFDKSVKRTWKEQDFKDAVSNAALGLTGEAGEVADLIKKAIYHERGFLEVHTLMPEEEGQALSVQDVKDELSDVLFYVSAMAQEFGFTLEDVAKHNKYKLEKRYENGFTIKESAEKRDKHENN